MTDVGTSASGAGANRVRVSLPSGVDGSTAVVAGAWAYAGENFNINL